MMPVASNAAGSIRRDRFARGVPIGSSEIARKFEAVEEIRRQLPEKACFAVDIVDRIGCLLWFWSQMARTRVLAGTHRAPEKMRGRKWAAISITPIRSDRRLLALRPSDR